MAALDAAWCIEKASSVLASEEKTVEEILIFDEAPAVESINEADVRVGQYHVFRNPNGTYSAEHIREVSRSAFGMTIGLGPIGHASRSFGLDAQVEILHRAP